jgi:hypothetical protein
MTRDDLRPSLSGNFETDPTWLADDDGGADGVTRIIAALDRIDPDDCPVKATHHKIIDTCAICGTEPRAKLELGSLANRPGGRWWEVRVLGAVLTAAACRTSAKVLESSGNEDDKVRAQMAREDADAYTDEVARLVTMAERHAS